MEKEAARERIIELRNEISRANYLYHVLDSPEIFRLPVDMYFKELVELETQFPEFYDSNSPTQKRLGGGEHYEVFKSKT